MVKRFGIDSLLLFLILGISLLWIAFPRIGANLTGDKSYRIVNLNVDDQVDFPKQGLIDTAILSVYNADLTLLYSLDGGDHFQESNGSLDLDKLENPPIYLQNTSIRWRHPKGDFPELTSLVLKVRNEAEGTESPTKTVTYFQKMPSELPVVHLTISQDDLFDWDKGVMIYGEESSHDTGFYKDWWYRSANFAGRGSAWAKKVVVHYFVAGDLHFEQACEMRISGNATRYFPQKSLKFFPLNSEGKKDKLDFPLWGEQGNKKSESFLLRQGGNDNMRTLYADLLMHQLAQESNVLTLNGFPVSVFMNGNYWGIYNLRERMDNYLIAKKENVSKADVTILYCEVYDDRSLLKAGNEDVKMQFDSLINALPEGEKLTDEAYDQLKTQISTKSFIDYIFFETFYANQDWLHNNTTWYKAGDKKWKWLLNDLDYSLAYPGEENVNANLFDKLKTSHSITAKLFNALWTKKKFKKKFKDRAEELIKMYLSDERIEGANLNLKNSYQTEIQMQINRWRFIDSSTQWEKDVAANVTFLKNRRTIYLKQLDDLE